MRQVVKLRPFTSGDGVRSQLAGAHARPSALQEAFLSRIENSRTGLPCSPVYPERRAKDLNLLGKYTRRP